MEYPAAVRFVSCEPLLGPIDLTEWLAPAAAGHGLNWVITGGESGSHSRPMSPAWAESIRDQCATAGVPFHFKQWGHWGPQSNGKARVETVTVTDQGGREIQLFKIGKHATGRRLGGHVHDGIPAAAI